MSMFNNAMFDSIKDALNKEASNQSSSGFSDILRFQKGNTFTVRLLPNTEDPSKTFFHYYVHGWESFATGQYTSFVSPQTFGERDPIGEYRYKIYKTGSVEEKEKSKSIIRSEKWLVNAYVIDDPVNPDNNGKVKIVRFGKQLHKIIMDAISGEDSDQFGARVFDLSENGCNLRIRIDDQGGFPTYVASKFLMPSGIPGIDPDAVYEGTTDLSNVFSIKSYEELQKGLDEHFHVSDSSSQASTPAQPTATSAAIQANNTTPVQEASPVKETATVEETSSSDDVALDDDKIKMLLQGLDG
jgi:hypothetical protein